MIEINIFNLFLKSGLLVKIILIILIYFSIASWTIIIQRFLILTSAIREAKVFENKFWSGIDLSNLYHETMIRRDRLSGQEQIFHAGFKEFKNLHYTTNNNAIEAILENVSRAMRISINRELEVLESNIPYLGIIGSISPYIGLFGTVLGIIHAFIELGTVKQVSLQMIAPGVSESLVATAIGLFAAIPAVMGFNRLNIRINKIEQLYDNFAEEFVTILQRQAIISKIAPIKQKV